MSASTFAVSWLYADGVENMPSALYVPVGTEPEQCARDYVAALAELCGLVGSEQEPDELGDDLTEMFRALVTAPIEYFGWAVRPDGSHFGLHVASHQHNGVLGLLDGDLVELVTIRPDRAFEEILTALPHHAPADIVPVSASAADLGIGDGFGPSRANSGQAALAVDTLREILDGDPAGKGQLCVATRTRSGQREVHPATVNYFDFEDGRVLVYSTDGGEYLTACPGTADAFAEQLGRL